MKRSALKAGETYAWNTTNGRSARLIFIVDADRLYERQTPRFGRRGGPIEPTNRTTATRGLDYPYVEVGILARHESGQEVLVNPAHIRAPWAEWQAKQAILDEREKESRKRRRQQERDQEETSRHLASLIGRSPYAGRINVGRGRTNVDNTLLIEILGQFDHA